MKRRGMKRFFSPGPRKFVRSNVGRHQKKCRDWANIVRGWGARAQFSQIVWGGLRIMFLRRCGAILETKLYRQISLGAKESFWLLPTHSEGLL